MAKIQRRRDTGEKQKRIAGHNVFHPTLKSDVFGGSDTQVLSVSQTAELLGLSEREVVALIDEQVLCAKQDISGKSWLVEKECAFAQRENFVKDVSFDPALEGVVGETFDAEPSEFGQLFNQISIGDLGDLSDLESLKSVGEDDLLAGEDFAPGELIGTAINTDDDGSSTTVAVEAGDRVTLEVLSVAARIDAMAGEQSDSQANDQLYDGSHCESEIESQSIVRDLAGLNRTQITDKHVREIMDSLDFANVRLEGAMYRIGYLEAQVDSLEQQLQVLPEFRSRAATAILIERENDILKEKLTEHQNMLEETNKILMHFANSRWYRFFAWALGVRLPSFGEKEPQARPESD